MARKPKVLPPREWLEPRVKVARALSLLAFLGLVGLLCGYYLFVADLHGARPWVILLIELVPLLILAPRHADGQRTRAFVDVFCGEPVFHQGRAGRV